MLKRGLRAALEYAASGDIAKARALANPDVVPHVDFVDMARHGYAVVGAGPDAIETEFFCIVRPIIGPRRPITGRWAIASRIGRGGGNRAPGQS